MDQKKLIHSCMTKAAQIMADVYDLSDDVEKIENLDIRRYLGRAADELIEAADHMQDCVSEHDDWGEADA